MSATPAMDCYSDLRSAAKDRKRDQDQKHKWANGSRCVVVGYQKERPVPKSHYRTSYTVPGLHCNLNKARNSQEYCHPSRVRTYLGTREELRDPMFQDQSRSFLKDLPSRNGHPRNMLQDGDVDNFNHVPLPAVALDSFVKTTGRETEQFVQQEFVIVDDKGQSASGNKARRILRKAERAADDHDGFEML